MPEQQGLRSLINGVRVEMTTLARDQAALAKAELRDSAQNAAATGGLFVGALVLAFLGFVFLLVTAAYGLVAAGLPVWAGFLIVALVLIVVAVVLALLGRSRAQRIKGPERAAAQLEKTKAAFSPADGPTT